MIYNCQILDHGGETHTVSIDLRGLEHGEVLIINGVSMEAYHQGIRYKELVSYTKEMESHGIGKPITCVKPTHPPVRVLKPAAQGIMASWLER